MRVCDIIMYYIVTHKTIRIEPREANKPTEKAFFPLLIVGTCDLYSRT